jgi:hypothetical protein
VHVKGYKSLVHLEILANRRRQQFAFLDLKAPLPHQGGVPFVAERRLDAAAPPK